MKGMYILDESGYPVPCDDTIAWGRWFEADPGRRDVAQNMFEGGVAVSTVFLGLDHSAVSMLGGRSADPVLWETMIFGGEHHMYQERYASREAAIEGHGRAVALAASGIGVRS